MIEPTYWWPVAGIMEISDIDSWLGQEITAAIRIVFVDCVNTLYWPIGHKNIKVEHATTRRSTSEKGGTENLIKRCFINWFQVFGFSLFRWKPIKTNLYIVCIPSHKVGHWVKQRYLWSLWIESIMEVIWAFVDMHHWD